MEINNFEWHNLLTINSAIVGRPALYSHLTISGSTFVGGCSLEAANTTEIFHYILTRNNTTGLGTITCYTEEFRTITSLEIGLIPVETIFTYAVQNRQVIFNSPGFSVPIYGLVGGGLKFITKVESINPNTAAILAPTGLCSSFGDRVVIAQGNILYFNDPGVDIRTFTGTNVVSLPSTIYDIFTNTTGNLVIGTADGLYQLTSDSLGQGQLVYGLLMQVSNYQNKSYLNICSSKGRLLGLMQGGVTELSAELSTLPLTTYQDKRYLSKNVGVGKTGDYRTGKIFNSSDLGPIVSINNNLCAINLDGGFKPIWITTASNLNLKAVLHTRDGKDLYLTDSFLLELYGEQEFDDQDFKAIACGEIPTPPEQSSVIRYITTSADNIGYPQQIYLSNLNKSAVTPKPSRANGIIGTNTWNQSGVTYIESELRSRRHHIVARTDDLALEIALSGKPSFYQLGEFDIETKNIYSKRPTN